MARFKPVRKDKKPKSRFPVGAIPCLILLVSGMALLSLLFYSVLKSG